MDFFTQNKSNVKQEVHHIAIFNDVIFPFRTHPACFLRALLTLVGDEVFIRDSLRANEAFLEVGVDLTSRLRRSRTDRDGPCTHFFYASSEVGLQIQQLIARADHAVQARLFQTRLGH